MNFCYKLIRNQKLFQVPLSYGRGADFYGRHPERRDEREGKDDPKRERDRRLREERHLERLSERAPFGSSFPSI